MRRALSLFWGGVEEIGKITIESLVEGLRMAPCQSDRPSMSSSNTSKPKCIDVVLRIHGLAA